jgi:hypothetical protein
MNKPLLCTSINEKAQRPASVADESFATYKKNTITSRQQTDIET